MPSEMPFWRPVRAVNLDCCGFQLVPPPTALESIGNSRPPCHESMDWTRWPRPFIYFLLGRSASVFGSLVLFGTFADHERRRYILPVAGSHCQCPDITSVIRQAHHESLLKWLRLNVEQKLADLAIYLDAVSGGGQVILNCTVEDILPLGPEMLPDSVLADTRRSVELLRALAAPDSPRPEQLLGGLRPASRLSRVLGMLGVR
jgi:hypothetical protein